MGGTVYYHQILFSFRFTCTFFFFKHNFNIAMYEVIRRRKGGQECGVATTESASEKLADSC